MNGALELSLLGLPLFATKRPFTDGALDVVLLETPNPENPVVFAVGAMDVVLLETSNSSAASFISLLYCRSRASLI